jgi:2-polyprenyl-3-methyl-5-hydroxy-6-metoxy-1,4-benzoquinol methylase
VSAETLASAAEDDWNVHWERFSDAAGRNPAQAYRRDLAMFLLARAGAPVRLLDIGSGTGDFLLAAARRWPEAELAGFDLSPAGVAESERKVPQARVRVRDLLQDPSPQPQESGWATHAVCSEVLEHVDDPVLFLRHCRGWLAPGCRLVVTVPGGPMSAFDRHIGHRRHFSAADLREVIAAAGLQPLLCAGAGFPFFDLYRAAVILRGERLVSDASVDTEGTWRARVMGAVMAAFQPLLPMSLPRSPLGWQTVGVAGKSD